MKDYQFIFFVRLEDGRIQEMSFSAESTKKAVEMLQNHLNPEDEIMNCYREIKNWKDHQKSRSVPDF